MAASLTTWQWQTIPHKTRVAIVGNWGRSSGRNGCRVRYATARWLGTDGKSYAWFCVQVGEHGAVVNRVWIADRREPYVDVPAVSGDGRLKVWRVA